MPNILCRLPNHIGDCCMALPGLQLLEQSGFMPVLVGKRWAGDLFAGMGWRFDPIEGHVTEDMGRIRRLAAVLGEKPRGLLFPNSFSSALLFTIGRVASAGFGTDGRGFLLDKKLPEPGKMHEVKRFFTLAHSALLAWGAKPAWDEVPPKLELKLLTRHEAGARNLIEKHDIPDRFALLAPVARGVHHGKRSLGRTSTRSAHLFGKWESNPSSFLPPTKRLKRRKLVRTPVFFRPRHSARLRRSPRKRRSS